MKTYKIELSKSEFNRVCAILAAASVTFIADKEYDEARALVELGMKITNAAATETKKGIIVYLEPDCEYDVKELERMPREEVITLAKNDNKMHLYANVEDFAEAFNDEFISDLGFILTL